MKILNKCKKYYDDYHRYTVVKKIIDSCESAASQGQSKYEHLWKLKPYTIENLKQKGFKIKDVFFDNGSFRNYEISGWDDE